MMKSPAVFALLFALTIPLAAQDWSVGVASGPFVFGDFLERKVRIGTGEGPSSDVTSVLTAATRAGLAVDVERRLNDRWAVRLEGTFTNAPLRLEQSGGGNDLDSGDLDVATFMLPVVFRINRNGAIRFHVMAGPALAFYRGNSPDPGGNSVFEETQSEWGAAFGGGVGWWMSDRFAIEGNITDIITTSPFDREDFSTATRVTTPNPHNVHTTVGLRWRF
ncbi:MAG: porin family protein [Acidobacteriota bacterium]|nr:porin family protein [Acidobacteriota bacterium]